MKKQNQKNYIFDRNIQQIQKQITENLMNKEWNQIENHYDKRE